MVEKIEILLRVVRVHVVVGFFDASADGWLPDLPFDAKRVRKLPEQINTCSFTTNHKETIQKQY